MKTNQTNILHLTIDQVENLNESELTTFEGGVLIETLVYWAVYYAGRTMHSVGNTLEKRPNDPHTYSQTYKMGSF